MAENTTEQTIDGFIYDGIAIGFRGREYEMKMIWIPSKRLIVDDRGHVDTSDQPCGSKMVHKAEEQYLDKVYDDGPIQKGKKILYDHDEFNRIQDEAQQKAMVPIKVSAKIVEELVQLISQEKEVQETLNEIKESKVNLSAQLF